MTQRQGGKDKCWKVSQSQIDKHWDTVVHTKTKIKEIGRRHKDRQQKAKYGGAYKDREKKLEDDPKTDRQKLKYGGSYARARLLQQDVRRWC